MIALPENWEHRSRSQAVNGYVYNWEGIRDSEPVLKAIRSVIAESGARKQ